MSGTETNNQIDLGQLMLKTVPCDSLRLLACRGNLNFDWPPKKEIAVSGFLQS